MTRLVVLVLVCVVFACSPASAGLDASVGVDGGGAAGGMATAGGAAAGGAAAAGGSAGGAVVDLVTYCSDATLEALCAFEVRCGLSKTRTGCVADNLRTMQQYGITSLCWATEPAVRDGRLLYQPAAAARCYAALATLDCRRAGAVPSDCSEVFEPRVQLGGSCFGTECARGWCDSSTTCPGVCKPFADAGAVVTDSFACGDLASAQQSSSTGVSWRCVVPSKLAEPCNPLASNVCEKPLLCNGATARCVSPRPAGVPCEVVDAGAGRPPSFSNDCEAPLSCQPGDAGVSICAGLRDVGEPCVYCKRDLRCSFSGARPVEGVCMTKGLSGDACLLSHECAPGFFCRGSPGTCQAQVNVGQTCQALEACQPGLQCIADGGSTGTCLSVDGGFRNFGCFDPTP